MPVRTARSDIPRAASPVISPSRGPGPKAAPMYMPVATPLSSTPESSNVHRAAGSWAGSNAIRQSSITRPTTTTLLSVPSPGRWRSGIHSSITSAPARQTQIPVPMPVWSESPWWSTSHGSLPSPDRMISEALAP